MCIPHVRVGSYAHELEGGMSSQIVWNSSTWEISLPSEFVSFSMMLFIYMRERGEKAWARVAEREGEAGSLLNREPSLGPGSWSDPKAEA